MADSPVLGLLVTCDNGKVLPYWGIVHEGKLWLVSKWSGDNETGDALPERLLQIHWAEAEPCNPNIGCDYVVNVSLPKAALDGPTLLLTGREVRIRPGAPRVDFRRIGPLPRLY